MDAEDTSSTPDDTRLGPFSRRRFLQATAGATALATAGTQVASAVPSRTTPLTFTAATGGSATLAPAGGKLADLTVVDGDPFTDFATLIRTVAVLRGGVPFEQADLVDAFGPTATRRHDLQRSAPAEDWLEVSRQMRREGCCSPESGV